MATRREFLQAGLAASILPMSLHPFSRADAAGVTSGATAPLGGTYYKVLFDRRFAESRAFGHEARRQGADVVAFGGDITDFWYADLSLRWREAPVAIAGMTAPGPLFCLERWGWDHGLRVVSRVEHGLSDAADPITGERQPLIAWVIAPRPPAADGV